MNKKQFIVEQLKNWYVLDHILIECEPTKCIKKGKLLKEYLNLKTSFLMTLHEFYLYKKIKTVKNNVKDNKVLQEQSMQYAKKAKKISAYMSSKSSIKNQLTQKVISESKHFKNKELKKVSDLIVEQNFLKLAMDNAFIGLPLLENKIFLDSLHKLHLKPEECVYIDDIEEYVKAANQMGIHGIHYISYEKLINSLKKLDIHF